MTEYVLFHARNVKPFVPCIDGLFAAIAAAEAMPNALLTPCKYGEPPELNLTSEDFVYLLDLSYPAPILEAWADTGAHVTVIDHHKQALEDLKYLSTRVLQTFSMNHSGAVLAWQYFNSDKEIPKLFRYVQDRDLWTKRLDGCDLVHMGVVELLDGLGVADALSIVDDLLKSEGRDWRLKELKSHLHRLSVLQSPTGASNTIALLKEVGLEVQVELDNAIAQAVDQHCEKLIMGHRVPFFVCQTSRQKQFYSDIAHHLLKLHPDAPFACVQTGRGWGLRSSESRLDVALIAKLMGGGGHRNASGCKAELPLAIALFEVRIGNLIQSFWRVFQ
jgi:oligoribonuclease NrnB/cAMP/cGMP phosphodiesterase (DHH superfamily)